jgi:hypothetical protein
MVLGMRTFFSKGTLLTVIIPYLLHATDGSRLDFKKNGNEKVTNIDETQDTFGAISGMPGNHFKDSLNLKNGEQLAAFWVAKSRVKEVKVRVTNFCHEAVDDDCPIDKSSDESSQVDSNPKWSGRTVRIVDSDFPSEPRDSDMIVLLRGDFKNGAVLSSDLSSLAECFPKPSMLKENLPLPKSKTCELKVGSTTYRITATPTELVEETNDGSSKFRFLVKIEQGGMSQVLNDVSSIAWAGDLNHDGKLDLIVDDAFHYAVGTSIQLFLSPTKKIPQLFELAGRFMSSGC